MTQKEHTQWIEKARQLAENALPEDVPVGALIVDENNQCIAQGWNQREKNHDPCGHAEIMALQHAGNTLKNWRLENCTLYVTLEPCPMCAAAIIQSRMPRVIFGAYDPLQGALGSASNLTTQTSHPITVTGGIDEDACQNQLQQFFKQQR